AHGAVARAARDIADVPDGLAPALQRLAALLLGSDDVQAASHAHARRVACVSFGGEPIQIEPHALLHLVHGRALIEQEVGVAAGHVADPARRAGRHPDRRVRLLSRRGLDHDLLVLPALAAMGKSSGRGPGLEHDLEAFGVALLGFVHRYAELLEFDLAIAAA